MNEQAEHKKVSTQDPESRLRNKIDINSTLILAIATLIITWCSYQSGLWDGIQTFRLAESNKLERLAQEKTLMTIQRQAMDQNIIITFVDDALQNRNEVIEYSLSRLRPELQQVLKAWIATQPFKNPAAPPHPMATNEYKAMMQNEFDEASKLRKRADAYWHRAQEANTYSDRYNLFSVILSMSLFLGAITTKLTHVRLSFTLTVVAGFICIAVLVLLFLFMPLSRE